VDILFSLVMIIKSATLIQMGNVRVHIGETGNVKFWSASLKERHKLGYSHVDWQIIYSRS
jgi:hypothetical protein